MNQLNFARCLQLKYRSIAAAAMVYITLYYTKLLVSYFKHKVQLKKDIPKITSNQFNCTNAIRFRGFLSLTVCFHDLSAIVIYQFSHQSYTNKAQRSADLI